MPDLNFKTIKPADLPAPPQTAIKIMRTCAKKTVNNRELTELTRNDPLLTAELLRVANSPFFSHGGSIKSIFRAIQLLGQRALRNLALCISVRDALKDCVIKDFDLALFWEDALRLGVSARLLGKLAGLDEDDCFTAGLLQDFGMLVLFHLHQDKGKESSRLRSLGPGKRLAAEKELFGIGHDQLIAELADAWSLPDNLAKALACHHRKAVPTAPWAALSQILHEADYLAALYRAKNKKLILGQCRKLLTTRYGLTEEQTDELLAAIPAATEEAATALGLHISKQEDLDEVLRLANLRVIKYNISYQELSWKFKKALIERDRLAAEMQRELVLAREVQKSLLPPEQIDFPIHGVNVAARQLSGDFYDYFPLADGRLLFNLGDVSGKGTTAALLMSKTISIFRCLGHSSSSPGEILTRINAELCTTNVRGMFVTMAAGLYDRGSGQLLLANAGHMPPLLITAEGRDQCFPAQAPPLGILPEQSYPNSAISLDNGSLYLYSDGVTEGFIGPDKTLGEKGLVALLRENSNVAPKERLWKIVEILQETPIRDDVTLLVVGK